MSDLANDMKNAHKRGYVGLEVTRSPPFIVLAVDDLIDEAYIRQGHAGYSNELVMAGDVLLTVDGESVETADVRQLHQLLEGCMHSVVELIFARGQSGERYHVKVCRHGPKEQHRRSPQPDGQKPSLRRSHREPSMNDQEPQVPAPVNWLSPGSSLPRHKGRYSGGRESAPNRKHPGGLNPSLQISTPLAATLQVYGESPSHAGIQPPSTDKQNWLQSPERSYSASKPNGNETQVSTHPPRIRFSYSM